MKVGIVNFAKGAWYPSGQARLNSSLDKVGFTGTRSFYSDESQFSALPHSQAPYLFKPKACRHAFVTDNLDILIWCDAAVWAHRDLKPLIDHIDKEGHVFFQAGFDTGQWTSDRCLEGMKMTREEAKQAPMIMACCFGIKTWGKGLTFLSQWFKATETPELFQGSWTNEGNTESLDPYCTGHRHDQSVASIIAYRLDMDVIVGHHSFFQYYLNGPFNYAGYDQNNFEGIGADVCLLSQGM